MSKDITGAKLAGGLSKYGRAEHDFYATNPEAVERLLATGLFDDAKYILEPCVGMGHIADVLERHGKHVSGIDIVDRGYPDTVINDFLTVPTLAPVFYFDTVITNPPFSLAVEFIERSFDFVKEGGYVAMFLKLAFLETKGRREFFKKYPPKYVYVFPDRMNTFRNGEETNEEGKAWATTMATGWFIWEKGFTGEPIIRWLD